MSIRSLLLVLTLSPPAFSYFAREESTWVGSVIDTVIVGGNTKTRTYVILDEMTLQAGMPVSAEALEFDRNRIYSLGLFTRVELRFDSLSTPRALYVLVAERWYIMPQIIFGFRDGDITKPYYGVGIYHTNVGGRNQKLGASVAFGYNPSFSFTFFDPLLDHESRLFAGMNLLYARIRNRSVIEASQGGQYDEIHYEGLGTFGKRFTLYTSVMAKAGLSVVKASPYAPGRTNDPDGVDSYLNLTAIFLRDSRDLAEYPLQGMYTEVYAAKYGFGESVVNFARYGVDFRRYFDPSEAVTVVTRLFGSVVSGGTVPPYARAYFGYGERIRGYFETVFEGDNQAGATVELRFPILRPRYYHFTVVDLPPEFAFWRIGLILSLFGDTGTAWFRGTPLTWQSFATGYGGGLDLVLPYSLIVRAAYALNDVGRGQFILDLRRPL